MRLSLIIPCLNEADGITALLQALQPLRARGAEIVVVDGESADDTIALAAPLADRCMIAPRGRASQMNAGAAGARGDVLLFLHADCRLPPDADRLVAEGLARTGRVWGRFDVKLTGTHPMLPVIARAMNARSRWTGVATGDQAIFVTRPAFEAIGGYPAIALMEDVALSQRLKRISAPVCLTEPVTASGRRWEKHGVWRTILLMWRLRLAYAFGVDPQALADRYVPHRS